MSLINVNGVKGQNVIGDLSGFIVDHCTLGVKIRYIFAQPESWRERVTHTTNMRFSRLINK